jgi:hypothetical protein
VTSGSGEFSKATLTSCVSTSCGNRPSSQILAEQNLTSLLPLCLDLTSQMDTNTSPSQKRQKWTV